MNCQSLGQRTRKLRWFWLIPGFAALCLCLAYDSPPDDEDVEDDGGYVASALA